MRRRLPLALSLLLGTGFALSCTDDPSPTQPRSDLPAARAIVDGARGGDPDFLWLMPTVPVDPEKTGTFDGGVLDQLAVEVCELNGAGTACAGEPIERFTSTGLPIPSRIGLDAEHELYTVNWLTGTSHLSPDLFYRVRVLRSGVELGSLDVDVVDSIPELAGVDASRYKGVKNGQPVALRFRIQVPTARTSVRINEIESSGGVPGDWVELANHASIPVSLEGYVLKDSDDGHAYAFPAGSSIAAGGFLVVDEAVFGFGLGGSDAVRLFTPAASVLVDSYAWSAHAVSSYGRCPDYSGGFQQTTTVTKGAANDCSVVVRINEVESSGGVPGDWVELYNVTPVEVSLAGWVFKDGDDSHSYVLPTGTTIPANGYLVLDEASFGFGLGSPDAARLFAPDGTTLIDSYAWTPHASTTYGRCPNGTGAFTTTASPTKGAANACGAPSTAVKVNEVESSGGVPGDWVELFNTSAAPADISGWIFHDSDDTHTYVIPAGSTIAPGGYFMLEEAAFGFGLGSPDAARLFAPDGVTVIDSYSWTPHASTTYGRCPNGTGAFMTTTSVTKGTANDCGVPIKINEVESSGGVPGDWVELFNPSPNPVNVSGFVFRDSDDTHNYAIPAGTTIASGGYYLLEEAAFGFGLGAPDAARLFAADGVALIDSYSWTAHAATTYGRCPNGSGAFTTTQAVTRGTANICPGDLITSPWPGDATVQTADVANVFGGNMSGLAYEGSGGSTPGVLWAAKNGPGTLYRLLWDGTNWVPDAANGWGAGKTIHFTDGTGNPDAESVTFAGGGSSAGLYVGIERNNDVSGTSHNAVLLFDPSGSSTSVNATREWNLTPDLPVTGANTGIEAITWIPDTYLVGHGFFDETQSHTYNPAEYAGHGTGLFFVGLEQNGSVYAYALDHVGGGVTRVATITSGFVGVMELQFDGDLGNFWAVCDDGCVGRSAVLEIGPTGHFTPMRYVERPTGMPNLNNEGFGISSAAECVADRRPVFWTDDSNTDGHAIRRGTITCTPFTPAPVSPVP